MMISKEFTYAVVGASNNKEKYGYKVLQNLLSRGFNAIPVNQKEDNILGRVVFKSIKDIAGKIDVVVTIVPPNVTELIAKQAQDIGISKVWMQPGSESETAINYCKEHDMDVVSNTCIMFAS